MKEKRILILGAANAQIPLIKKAREMGFYVIVCTYDPTEPGIEFANEYQNVSTTDKEAVKNMAMERGVNAVTSWASDVAAPAAAYAAEVMGLPGNSFLTVKMLTRKDLFREFLTQHRFSTPGYQILTEKEIHSGFNVSLTLPLIVKPVDSSGGRGVARVNKMSSLNAAVLDALSYSGNKKVIIEEVIEKAGTQIHGDGFVLNGNLVFTHLGDHHFSHISDVIPVATSWPSRIPANLLQKLISEIGKCVNRSGLQFGPINIEARIDINHNIYIIELAPRAGVHSGSDLTKLGAGVDLPLETMKYLDGQKVNIEKLKTDCVAYYILHSKLTGYFSELTIDPAVEKYITNLTIKANNGDKVRSYKNMKDAVGVINLMFDNREEMSKCMDQIDKFVSVVVK